MAFKLLFVLMHLIMLGGAWSSKMNDGDSSSWPKSKRNDGESSFGVSYPKGKKYLSFDSFTLQSGIHKQSLEPHDFDVANGGLGYLEAQGWLSAFTNPKPRAIITLIAEFYHSLNQ